MPNDAIPAGGLSWQRLSDDPDDDMHAHRLDFTAGCARQAAESIEELAQHVYGDSEAARYAVESGFFEFDGADLALRYAPATAQVEFFCDIGHPDAHYATEAYRKLLELNLCRTYPGITFGLHPESGQMVATLAVHAIALGEPGMVVALSRRLVACVRDVLSTGALLLA